MGCPSKWPGCKVVKSAHGFGRPGKKLPRFSLAEFVAGYAQILQSKDISALERSDRLKNPASLMHLAQLFE